MVEARACCPRDACYTHCARHLTPLYVPLSEPWRPVGDMQAVSCGARSRQYSRLLPASSSQPRSIFERAGSEPMGRVHIYIGILFAQYRRPLLTDLSTAPVMRRAQRRTAVWEGRGATARPREAKWSSGVAGVLGYLITRIFSNIHLDVPTTTTTTTTSTEHHCIARI